MMKPLFRVLALLAISISFGCATGPDRPKNVVVEKAYEHHLNRLEALKQTRDEHCVIVFGPDSIAKSSTAIKGPNVEGTYTFHVWVDDQAGSSPEDLLRSDELRIEVFGVKDYRLEKVVNRITERIAKSEPESPNESADTYVSDVERRATNTINVIIEPKDITGDVTIMAWLPAKFREYQLSGKDDNPWLYRKEIKTYDGDLQTNLVMLSQDEVELQFGKHFAKYFFVGRVNIHNANPKQDQKLLVYTTTMRPLVYFYTEPDPRMAPILMAQSPTTRSEFVRSRLAQTSTGITRTEFNVLVEKLLTEPINTGDEVIVKKSGFSQGYDPAKFNQAVDMVIALRGALRPAIKSAATHLELSLSDDVKTQDVAAMETTLGRILVSPGLEEVIAGYPEQFTGVEGLAWKMENRKIPRDLTQHVVRELAETVEAVREGVWSQYVLSPMSFPRTIDTGLNGDPLAYSDDLERQARLNEHGYIWKGYYRPMSFQSVLNALIEITEQSPEHTVMRWLESAGVVAGGLIGIGSIANEVTKPQYVEAVAVMTAVVLPEMRKLILFDLKKYIRNLGELGMDTILEVEAQDYVEKYVFFPRGPIFNEADEFGVGKASYIVKVDARDMAVDAEIVELKRDFSTGSGLVARAISEEEVNRQMALDLNDQMRRFALVALNDQVQNLRAAGKTEEADAALARYESVYGHDASGTVDSLRADIRPLEIKGLPSTTEGNPKVMKASEGPLTMPFSIEAPAELANDIDFFHRVPKGQEGMLNVEYAKSETLSSSRAIVITLIDKDDNGTFDGTDYPETDATVTIYAVAGKQVTKQVVHISIDLN